MNLDKKTTKKIIGILAATVVLYCCLQNLIAVLTSDSNLWIVVLFGRHIHATPFFLASASITSLL